MQAYNNIDQRLHLLIQTIAKANRTYVTTKPDDSHTNLYFDELDNRLVGHWINNGQEKLMLTLNLETLDLEWLNDTKELIYSVPTTGRLVADFESEIESKLPEINLRAQGFIDGLHYQIPDYPFAREPISSIDKASMDDWKSYRNLANELCALVLGDLQLEDDIRIWPHHFDTGIYVEVSKKLGLGFGLAMEDNIAGAPYFYMSGYPLQGSLEYSGLPELITGGWEIGENWSGSILPINKLKNGLYEDNKDAVNDYLSKSINWFVSRS